MPRVHLTPGGAIALDTGTRVALLPGGAILIEAAAAGGSLTPSGIASAEAFGTPLLSGAIAPSAIGSSETHGSATVGGTNTLAPAGIASAETHGTALLSGALAPAGIASAEAHGTPTVTAAQATISPSGIVTAEAFGSTTVSAVGASIRMRILDAVLAALRSMTGFTPADVLDHRPTALPRRTGTPFVRVEFGAEQISTLPADRAERELELRIQVIGRGDDPHRVCEATVNAVHAKMLADIRWGALAVNTEETSIEWSIDDADQDACAAELTYRVTYRTTVASHITTA